MLCLLRRDLQISSFLLLSSRDSIETTATCIDPYNGSVEALNNQTYTWYGNQWIPPPGVPLYTREEIREVFSQFDTLWIGDSTARRAYATTFALMNSTNSSISVSDLNKYEVIDVNKYFFRGMVDEDSCTTQRARANEFLQPGMVNMWTNASLCRRVGKRSFDYIRTECLKELSDISRLHSEMKRYSLVIIGMGIHDALKPQQCALGTESSNTSMAKNVRVALTPYQNLEKQAINGWQAALQIADTMKHSKANDTSPTAVLWRTSGFDSKGGQSVTERVLYLNHLSSDFLQNKSITPELSNGTLALVDWGASIYPRSLPPNKIEGDLSAHYGLEARMLMAQMTTQQLRIILERSKVR